MGWAFTMNIKFLNGYLEVGCQDRKRPSTVSYNFHLRGLFPSWQRRHGGKKGKPVGHILCTSKKLNWKSAWAHHVEVNLQWPTSSANTHCRNIPWPSRDLQQAVWYKPHSKHTSTLIMTPRKEFRKGWPRNYISHSEPTCTVQDTYCKRQ